MSKTRNAKFKIGQVVRHRLFPFRGVVFDIDPEFNNTEEWYQSIPAEVRPQKDQPFYHLFAENAETEYIAYVSEQNLLPYSTIIHDATEAWGPDSAFGHLLSYLLVILPLGWLAIKAVFSKRPVLLPKKPSASSLPDGSSVAPRTQSALQ